MPLELKVLSQQRSLNKVLWTKSASKVMFPNTSVEPHGVAITLIDLPPGLCEMNAQRSSHFLIFFYSLPLLSNSLEVVTICPRRQLGAGKVSPKLLYKWGETCAWHFDFHLRRNNKICLRCKLASVSAWWICILCKSWGEKAHEAPGMEGRAKVIFVKCPMSLAICVRRQLSMKSEVRLRSNLCKHL